MDDGETLLGHHLSHRFRPSFTYALARLPAFHFLRVDQIGSITHRSPNEGVPRPRRLEEKFRPAMAVLCGT